MRVLNNPLKFGRLNGSLYIEAHPPLFEQRKMNLQQLAQHQLVEQKVTESLNRVVMNQELNQPTGVPKKITN